MKTYRIVAMLLAVLAVASAIHAEDNVPATSVSEFHMTGSITPTGCELVFTVILGEQGTPAVNLAAFSLKRTSDAGEMTSFNLTPTLEPLRGAETNSRTFSYTDTTTQAGSTYRYQGYYEGDVFLTTCQVVLTAHKESNVVATASAAELRVEVLGNNVCMGSDLLLLRARASDPKATLTWSSVQPCMGKLLAQHNGVALIRAPEEVGSGNAFFKIEARLGDKVGHTYFSPIVFSIDWVPSQEIAPVEVKEISAGSAQGKALLKEKLARAYGQDGGSVECCLLNEFLDKVDKVEPAAAVTVHEYMDQVGDSNTKFAVFNLLAGHWPLYTFEHFFAEALAKVDLPRLNVSIGCLSRIKGEHVGDALKALQQCLQSNEPVIRLQAVQALDNWNDKTKACELLSTLLDTDTDAAVRFAAASTLNDLRTGKSHSIPALPTTGSVTSSRADLTLARKLYLQAVADLGKPIQLEDLNEKKDYIAPSGGVGLGGIIAEHRQEGLDALRPDSTQAKLCVMGDAILPIFRKRYLLAEPQERELLTWIIKKNNIGFPVEVEDKAIDAFYQAKPEDRLAALQAYRNLTIDRPKMFEPQCFPTLDFTKLSARERLRCLADADSCVRSIYAQNFENERKKLFFPPLNRKPANNSYKEINLWILVALQQQDDAVGQYARQEWGQNAP